MGTYYNDNGDLKLISGATLWADAPIGAINAYGGATAPNGWLLCQGQAISRTEYAELFAVIGTAYGSGDGSTTFNVPDLRESTIKGAGLTGLSNNHMDADGLAVGEFIDDRLQYHPHNTYLDGIQVSAGNLWATHHDYSTDGTHTSNPESPARTGNTTEVKAVGANFIIKAKQVALPLDIQSEVDKKLDKFYLDKSGLDLNNCTEAGFYEINTSVENMPTGADGGNMLVSHNPTSGAIVQTYFATNGTIASRYKLNSVAWTSWINPFTNRPALQYAKNVQYTSDAAGNIVFANSINNVVIVSVRVRGNYTWSEGYSDTSGCYIHLMDPYGQTLTNATVSLDIIYYSYDWTAA